MQIVCNLLLQLLWCVTMELARQCLQTRLHSMAENLRNIWNVSPMTHCDVICLLSGCKPLHIGLQKRFCKFAEGIYRHGSHTVRAIANSALSNPMSESSVIISMNMLAIIPVHLMPQDKKSIWIG